MSTFTFKCPACACALDVEDESRGETSECPNCQAEIRIPLVKSPQVRVPPMGARPVQKKKIVISEQTADAMAEIGRPRQTSHAGVVTALFGGLVLGIVIGACSPVRLSTILAGDFHSPACLSFLRPSKGEWKSKLLQSYTLQNNRILFVDADKQDPKASAKYAVKGFQIAMGKPDKIETVGDDRALSYVCNDGQIQVLISSTNYDAGQIAGALVNDD